MMKKVYICAPLGGDTVGLVLCFLFQLFVGLFVNSSCSNLR